MQALLDEREIRETLCRYGRGVDRMDRALTRSCWHADGTADYRGMFTGSADALLDWMWKVHAGMETHSHQMTSTWLQLAGDRAASETYVTVALRTKRVPARDLFTRGRYVDRWSRRAGRWGIDHRVFLNDWSSSAPAPEAPGPALTGRRDAEDASYAAFAELVNGASGQPRR